MRIECFNDPLAGGNCYIIIEGDACVVIDPCAEKGLFEKLKDLDAEPCVVLMTHEHCDHVGGLEALRMVYPRARVLATPACNKGIQSKRLNMSMMMEAYYAFQGKSGMTYEPFICNEVDRLISDGEIIDFAGHTIRVMELPGHTGGSCGFMLDDDIFFSGDYLLPGRKVLLRLPGGSSEAYEGITMPKLRELREGMKIYPGHEEPYILRKKDMEYHGL